MAGDSGLPNLEALKGVMPHLEEALGVVMIPTLGVPVRPNPLNQPFPHVERALERYRHVIAAMPGKSPRSSSPPSWSRFPMTGSTT